MSVSLYIGTDREKIKASLRKAIDSKPTVSISDAHSVADLQEALRGPGMFGEKRTVILDDLLSNDEMRTIVLKALPALAESKETFFILEEKLDAATRKKLEKYAEKIERFDLVKKNANDHGGIFALAYALQRADKKALWVAYQRALAPPGRGERATSPEAIHGVLFWGAKDMFMKSKGKERERAQKLIAELAELPHEARRKGFDLEYALEHFILAMNKS